MTSQKFKKIQTQAKILNSEYEIDKKFLFKVLHSESLPIKKQIKKADNCIKYAVMVDNLILCTWWSDDLGSYNHAQDVYRSFLKVKQHITSI